MELIAGVILAVAGLVIICSFAVATVAIAIWAWRDLVLGAE